MTTRSVTRSIVIEAAPAKVWDVISRIDTISDWYDGWDRTLSAEADCAVHRGVSFRLVRSLKDGVEVADCTVTELLPGARLQWVESCRGTELRQTRSWPMMSA